MLEKKFTPKRTVCKVTFKIPGEWAQNSVHLVGDFNDWDEKANMLKKKKDHWETTLRLKPKLEYHFRYLLDGEKWENDDAADRYIVNEFGTDNSVLITGK